MVKREDLNSLTALRKRRKAIKLEMELSKRELAHSLGVARTDLQDFLVKKVALPVGAAGMGLFVVSRLLSSQQKQKAQTQVVHHYHDDKPRPRPRQQRKPEEQSGSSTQIGKLLKQWWPILQAGLGFAMGYLKKDAEQPDAPRPGRGRAHFGTPWRR